ncbi:hypothetical protein [Edaphocola aurantiacus]|uniref:hypothetical protein n=1 Tax=Edaphocola aurantiacus TaxID=2601682 RepID=UPI001C942C27|nr:hypothetical protein [Edaphocola aurantiacus]
MKKAKLIIIALSVLLLCAGMVTFYSCSKEAQPGQCGYGPTVLKSHIQKQITFPNKLSKTVSFLDMNEYRNRPDACIYAWAEESTTPKEMVQILNSFGISEIHNPDNLLGIITYYNSDSTPYRLDNDLIYGFLLLTTDDKGYMYTQVFQRKGNDFVHLPQFDSKIWKLYMDQRNDLAQILNGRKTNLGYAVRIIYRQSSYKQARIGTRTNSFQHQISNELKGLSTLEYSNAIMRKFTEPEHAGNRKCTIDECKVTGNGHCSDAFPSEIAFCDEDKTIGETCGGKVAYQIAAATNNNVMNATVHFRDYVLSQSSYGIHFTEDLEYVGYIFTQHLSVADAVEVVGVMESTIYPLARKLISPDVLDDNSIFITAPQATTLQNIITRIRAVSDDRLYQEILDEMSANVTYVQGKTTVQVYTDLVPGQGS